MESKITRYSAAAVVALATALVLLSPFGTSKIGGVVLADVQQKVNGIETMIIRGTKTFTHPGKDGDVFEFDGFKGEFDLVKYVSKQHGLVEEGYVKDKLIYRFTFNRPKRQTLLVLPLGKKYGTFTSTDKQMQLLENATPKGIINLLMGGDYQELGRDNINGVEVEVFEFQDPVTFNELLPKAILDIQNIKGKVWIGVEEQLPVRIEGDLTIGKSFMTMFHDLNLHEVNTLGEYNVELDEDIFDTKPPEGYTELTLTDILPLIPVKVKAGLAGLGIAPAGIIFWKRRKRKRATANQN
jgi:outer membrane lipoprotein-sorting protein